MTPTHRIVVRCDDDERPFWTQILSSLNLAFPAEASDERPLWPKILSSLRRAFKGEASFDLKFVSTLDAAAARGSDLVCLSMLPDLRHGMEGGPGVEAEWRAAASKLRDHVIARGAPVFIVTIFRHLPREQRDALPFLRRLNLMALRLSQEFGLFVIDLDRVLTHRGAIPIGADAWLLGDPARSVAGDAIVDVLLAAGVDHLFDDVALKRALSSQAAQRAGRPAHLSGE